MLKKVIGICSLALLFVVFAGNVLSEDFTTYIKTSKDFQRIPQKKEILESKRWNEWVLMPWRASWGREYDKDCATILKNAGFNGGFCNRRPRADADLHEQNGFLWYLDHTAGKGDLHLRKAGKQELKSPNRPRCLLDPQVITRLKKNIQAAVTDSKKFKTRIAYALDDEVSWSSFTSPCKWDNSPLSRADFARWLKERYGSESNLKKEWQPFAPSAVNSSVNWGSWTPGNAPPADYIKRMLNPDDLQEFYNKPMDQWNLAAWCDALSYMDSQFANLIGDLVEYANTLDPTTPCGFVGGQGPAPYGGYDYAKVLRKIQFLEAYDIGASMEIVRSLNPGNEISTVKTSFGNPADVSVVWGYWYYMVHGDKGIITWAKDWFKNGKVSLEDIKKTGAEIQEVAKASKKIIGGKWMQNGVAIYYSHPSIQVSWFIDCQRHKKTWINRKSSMNNSFASSMAVSWAWQKLLEDYGAQYNWVSYASLLKKGINPKKYKVLILPRVLCMSKEEADAIKKYVKNGGHVIADHQTGIFDEHGKAYPKGKGILDDLMGVKNRTVAKNGTLFHGGALTEIDAEKYHKKKNFINAGEMSWPLCERTPEGFPKAQRDMGGMTKKKTGKGWVAHLNASIVEYTLIRKKSFAKCADYAKPVTDLLAEAGIKTWLKLSVDGKVPAITEATYWKKNGRIYVCVVKNPLKFASEYGATKTEGVTDKKVNLTITFKKMKKGIINEITGKKLGTKKSVTVPWQENKAAIVSFKI